MTAVRGYLVAWRATLRIARRTALRSRGRSLLVLAMIALPVYAGTVIAVSVRTTTVPWQTQARWQLGQADAVLTENSSHGTDTPPTSGDFNLVLPAGTHTLPSRTWFIMPITTPDGTMSVTSWATDLADPLVAGWFRTRAGHPPRAADEVALSVRLAADTHAGIGDTVRLGEPEQQRRVVAVVDKPSDLSARFVVTAPDFPVPLSARLALRDGGRHRNRTGAAVAAVAAAVAGSVALNLYLASPDDADRRRPSQLRLGQVAIAGDPTEIRALTASDLAPVARTLPVRDTVLVPDVAAGPSAEAEPMTLGVWDADGQWIGTVAVGDTGWSARSPTVPCPSRCRGHWTAAGP